MAGHTRNCIREHYAAFEQVDTTYSVQDVIEINSATVRWIVGVPNHIRAWTHSACLAARGYSHLHVADDYRLPVRGPLTTRFVHIPRLGYIQFHNTDPIGNTQRRQNHEIQRIARMTSGHRTGWTPRRSPFGHAQHLVQCCRLQATASGEMT